MDKLKAASIIEEQALKSLTYKTANFLNHPIRLIQASKSLIGLNLDEPNQKLLKFNSSILKNQLSCKSNFQELVSQLLKRLLIDPS